MDEKLPDKIMVVSHKPPYPPVDGGCIAMEKFKTLLDDIFSGVDYFMLSTPKHPFIQDAFPTSWTWGENAFHYFIDTRVKTKDIFRFISGASLRVSRFYDAAIAEELVQRIIEKKTELVIFESIYAAIYSDVIRKKTKAKICIRSHNIEYKIWEEQISSVPNKAKKQVLKLENKQLKKYEEDCYAGSDGNIFISEKDQNSYTSLTGKKNSLYIPVQMETAYSGINAPALPLRLFHIGAMDWEPNITGIEKFIVEIFPVILKKNPGTELHLAGKSMPESFKKYAGNGIFIHGEVPSSAAFMQKYDVLIVPVETGSGIRIKILEAMANGKPVITTYAGIQGIDASHGEHFIQANTPQEWAAGIEKLSHPSVYTSMAQEAGTWLNKNYSTEYLRSVLKTYFTEILNIV